MPPDGLRPPPAVDATRRRAGGSAATIAEDANYRLLRSHVQASAASMCTPEVAVVTISQSGSTSRR